MFLVVDPCLECWPPVELCVLCVVSDRAWDIHEVFFVGVRRPSGAASVCTAAAIAGTPRPSHGTRPSAANLQPTTQRTDEDAATWPASLATTNDTATRQAENTRHDRDNENDTQHGNTPTGNATTIRKAAV